jgi:protein YIPF6
VDLDDDDDLDEDAIPGFAHPTIASTPHSAAFDKGKGRITEQLASPVGASGTPRTPTLSGNIGTTPSGAPKPSRRTIGGVQVENRYAFTWTLIWLLSDFLPVDPLA